MKIELIYEPELELKKVSYCTVQVIGKPLSELHDFQIRMSKNKKDKRQLGEINRFIERIGNLYGAEERFFKREGWAERLPPPTYRFIDSDGESDFGLRQYCIRLNDELVILLNGDRKTTQSVKRCPLCRPHFDLANKISDAIYIARQDGKIEIEGRDIFIDDDFTLEI